MMGLSFPIKIYFLREVLIQRKRVFSAFIHLFAYFISDENKWDNEILCESALWEVKQYISRIAIAGTQDNNHALSTYMLYGSTEGENIECYFIHFCVEKRKFVDLGLITLRSGDTWFETMFLIFVEQLHSTGKGLAPSSLIFIAAEQTAIEKDESTAMKTSGENTGSYSPTPSMNIENTDI